MKNTNRLGLLCLSFFVSLAPLVAQENAAKPFPLRLVVGGGLELGGDKIAEVYFTNGNTQAVKAGQGGSVFVGAQYAFPRLEQLLLRATIGYKYVTTEADNVHIRLRRIPVHLNANWMITDQLMVGAGVAMHQSIRFKTDGLGNDMDFANASGPRFEVSYAGVGLTYTAMKYTDQAKHTYSANAVGLSFTGVIPRRR
jgi:hypothetical protein